MSVPGLYAEVDAEVSTTTGRRNLARIKRIAAPLCIVSISLVVIVVCFLPDGGGEREVDHVANSSSDGSRIKVWLGNGCFWHTQFDTVQIEQDRTGPFARSDPEVTSLVGYAGGDYTGAGGLVCYPGGPAGSQYEPLGHAEACQVELDTNRSRTQFAALLRYYFENGFRNSTEPVHTISHKVTQGRIRLDPQDYGPPYRNVIGLPGGVNGSLYDLVVAANIYSMPLLPGRGGPNSDLEDEFTVYIYDSLVFPFHVAERYHQFHENSVLRRPVPKTYTDRLKLIMWRQGRLNSKCDA